jgi:hypothetical protein
MSTITTTPAPQMSRTPLVIGIATIGVVAVAAVAVPRITALTGTDTSTVSTTVVVPKKDFGDHRSSLDKPADSPRLRAAERRMELQAKQRAAAAAAAAVGAGLGVTVVSQSTQAQQVGGQHSTYAYTPAAPPRFVYSGRGLVEVSPSSFGTVWNDTFVPPFKDPSWKAAIEKHYGGHFTTPTHTFR